MMESVHQPIIPGLPDDLALRCLAMLSHGHHGVAETVSKRWRDVLRGEEYANFKAREGWSGDWLFVLTANTLTQWIAYDPDADRWHPLPPRAHLHYGMNYFSCHCVSNKFLVIGGRYWSLDRGHHPPGFISNEVFQFDPFKKEWSTVATMRTPRFYFASCTLGGKIYVAGGRSYSDYPEGMNLAEVYDPLTDKWEDLPPMHLPSKSCTGIAYQGKFHVINVRAVDHDLHHHTEVFDSLSRTWHIKHESWFSRNSEVAVTDDQVYTLSEWDGSIVRRDAEKDEWHAVGEVPPLFHPADSQLREAAYFGLAALGHELYAIGGEDYKMIDFGDEKVGDLDRVRVCDPRCSPLIWRETRPMCLNASGNIMPWASLKQQ